MQKGRAMTLIHIPTKLFRYMMINSGMRRISTLRISFFSKALCHSASLLSNSEKKGSCDEGPLPRTSVFDTSSFSVGGVTAALSFAVTTFGTG
jgi:hypothetical protein